MLKMFLYPLTRLEMVSIQIAIYHSRTPPWKVLRDRSFVSVHTSDLAGASVLSSSTIWRFPNMEVPISMGFSPINHPAMGVFPLMDTHHFLWLCRSLETSSTYSGVFVPPVTSECSQLPRCTSKWHEMPLLVIGSSE